MASPAHYAADPLAPAIALSARRRSTTQSLSGARHAARDALRSTSFPSVKPRSSLRDQIGISHTGPLKQALRRERHKGDVGRDHKVLRLMPARLIHKDEGMRPGCDCLRDLLHVQIHAFGGAAGQNQASSFALSWANCAKDVGRGGPLVLGG